VLRGVNEETNLLEILEPN